jgi:hypothetical protein
MKRMKIALMAMLVALTGTTFTSCLNSDGGLAWDTTAVVTVEEFMGSVVLLTDDGYKFKPSNPALLQYENGTYAKRCEIALSWNEGVVFDGDRSKTYGITIIQTGYVYPIRNFCDQVDTIKNDYPISEVTSQFWGANGEYLTATWSYKGNSQYDAVSFDMYPEAVENNVLIMRLRQSVGSPGYNTFTYFTSFTLPSLSYINSTLGTSLASTNDSVQVKIAYKPSSDSDEIRKTSAVKIKIDSY